jgi:hypothetical protein
MSPSKRRRVSVKLQDRDLGLLESLFESRVMTAAHICALHFDGHAEMAKKRIQKLVAAGFIKSGPRDLFERAVYFIEPGGISELRDRGAFHKYPMSDAFLNDRRTSVSRLTIAHEVEVMDVKTAISRAAKAARLPILEFTTWPILNQFPSARSTAGQTIVRPDGFIRIRDTGMKVHSFYVELDRSTESQRTLVAKANCYLGHYRSGGFALRAGGSRSAYQRHPFRVLYILKTAARRDNTIERLLRNNPPILTQVWLTTLAEVIENPLGEIWIRPIDYRNACPPAHLKHTQTCAASEHKYRKLCLLDGSGPCEVRQSAR